MTSTTQPSFRIFQTSKHHAHGVNAARAARHANSVEQVERMLKVLFPVLSNSCTTADADADSAAAAEGSPYGDAHEHPSRSSALKEKSTTAATNPINRNSDEVVAVSSTAKVTPSSSSSSLSRYFSSGVVPPPALSRYGEPSRVLLLPLATAAAPAPARPHDSKRDGTKPVSGIRCSSFSSVSSSYSPQLVFRAVSFLVEAGEYQLLLRLLQDRVEAFARGFFEGVDERLANPQRWSAQDDDDEEEEEEDPCGEKNALPSTRRRLEQLSLAPTTEKVKESEKKAAGGESMMMGPGALESAIRLALQRQQYGGAWSEEAVRSDGVPPQGGHKDHSNNNKDENVENDPPQQLPRITKSQQILLRRSCRVALQAWSWFWRDVQAKLEELEEVWSAFPRQTLRRLKGESNWTALGKKWIRECLRRYHLSSSRAKAVSSTVLDATGSPSSSPSHRRRRSSQTHGRRSLSPPAPLSSPPLQATMTSTFTTATTTTSTTTTAGGLESQTVSVLAALLGYLQLLHHTFQAEEELELEDLLLPAQNNNDNNHDDSSNNNNDNKSNNDHNEEDEDEGKPGNAHKRRTEPSRGRKSHHHDPREGSEEEVYGEAAAARRRWSSPLRRNDCSRDTVVWQRALLGLFTKALTDLHLYFPLAEPMISALLHRHYSQRSTWICQQIVLHPSSSSASDVQSAAPALRFVYALQLALTNIRRRCGHDTTTTTTTTHTSRNLPLISSSSENKPSVAEEEKQWGRPTDSRPVALTTGRCWAASSSAAAVGGLHGDLHSESYPMFKATIEKAMLTWFRSDSPDLPVSPAAAAAASSTSPSQSVNAPTLWRHTFEQLMSEPSGRALRLYWVLLAKSSCVELLGVMRESFRRYMEETGQRLLQDLLHGGGALLTTTPLSSSSSAVPAPAPALACVLAVLQLMRRGEEVVEACFVEERRDYFLLLHEAMQSLLGGSEAKLLSEGLAVYVDVLARWFQRPLPCGSRVMVRHTATTTTAAGTNTSTNTHSSDEEEGIVEGALRVAGIEVVPPFTTTATSSAAAALQDEEGQNGSGSARVSISALATVMFWSAAFFPSCVPSLFVGATSSSCRQAKGGSPRDSPRLTRLGARKPDEFEENEEEFVLEVLEGDGVAGPIPTTSSPAAAAAPAPTPGSSSSISLWISGDNANNNNNNNNSGGGPGGVRIGFRVMGKKKRNSTLPREEGGEPIKDGEEVEHAPRPPPPQQLKTAIHSATAAFKAWVEAGLRRAADLCTFFIQKAFFRSALQRMLAQRLLAITSYQTSHPTTLSPHALPSLSGEHFLIAALQSRCGQGFTAALTTMLRELENEAELTRLYYRWLEAGGRTRGIQISARLRGHAGEEELSSQAPQQQQQQQEEDVLLQEPSQQPHNNNNNNNNSDNSDNASALQENEEEPLQRPTSRRMLDPLTAAATAVMERRARDGDDSSWEDLPQSSLSSASMSDERRVSTRTTPTLLHTTGGSSLSSSSSSSSTTSSGSPVTSHSQRQQRSRRGRQVHVLDDEVDSDVDGDEESETPQPVTARLSSTIPQHHHRNGNPNTNDKKKKQKSAGADVGGAEAAVPEEVHRIISALPLSSSSSSSGGPLVRMPEVHLQLLGRSVWPTIKPISLVFQRPSSAQGGSGSCSSSTASPLQAWVAVMESVSCFYHLLFRSRRVEWVPQLSSAVLTVHCGGDGASSSRLVEIMGNSVQCAALMVLEAAGGRMTVKALCEQLVGGATATATAAAEENSTSAAPSSTPATALMPFIVSLCTPALPLVTRATSGASSSSSVPPPMSWEEEVVLDRSAALDSLLLQRYQQQQQQQPCPPTYSSSSSFSGGGGGARSSRIPSTTAAPATSMPLPLLLPQPRTPAALRKAGLTGLAAPTGWLSVVGGAGRHAAGGGGGSGSGSSNGRTTGIAGGGGRSSSPLAADEEEEEEEASERRRLAQEREEQAGRERLFQLEIHVTRMLKSCSAATPEELLRRLSLNSTSRGTTSSVSAGGGAPPPALSGSSGGDTPANHNGGTSAIISGGGGAGRIQFAVVPSELKKAIERLVDKTIIRRNAAGALEYVG